MMKHGRSSSGNRLIALPRREPHCSFSYMVLPSGGVPSRHVTRPIYEVRAAWGAEAPWHVPNHRQGAAMIHGAMAPQEAKAPMPAESLVKTELSCESPL